jgi:signal transduction histidine kinase
MLVRQTEATGVSVNLSMRGLSAPLDPSVEMAAYRVVQEALTNVTRHAGPGSHADVVLFQHEATLAIDVDNDHAGSVPSITTDLSSGFGLVGLRERVKLMGGELSVGPHDGGGYRVHAVLPTAVAS